MKRVAISALVFASAAMPSSRAFCRSPFASATANHLARTMASRRALDSPGSRALSPFGASDPFTGLIDDLLFPLTTFRGTSQIAPLMSVDVKETDKEYQLFVDVPGVDKKDIDIKVKGEDLVIRAHREAHKKEEGENFHRVERSSGHASRIFTLPHDANIEDIIAENKDGVLVVTIKKKEDAAQKNEEKTIEIK